MDLPAARQRSLLGGKVCGIISPETSFLVQAARAHLVKLSKWLRDRDKEAGCNNCAIADLLFLYAHTINWFQAIRDYKASSPTPSFPKSVLIMIISYWSHAVMSCSPGHSPLSPQSRQIRSKSFLVAVMQFLLHLCLSPQANMQKGWGPKVAGGMHTSTCSGGCTLPSQTPG